MQNYRKEISNHKFTNTSLQLCFCFCIFLSTLYCNSFSQTDKHNGGKVKSRSTCSIIGCYKLQGIQVAENKNNNKNQQLQQYLRKQISQVDQHALFKISNVLLFVKCLTNLITVALKTTEINYSETLQFISRPIWLCHHTLRNALSNQ